MRKTGIMKYGIVRRFILKLMRHQRALDRMTFEQRLRYNEINYGDGYL